jgi:hypothetical protein
VAERCFFLSPIDLVFHTSHAPSTRLVRCTTTSVMSTLTPCSTCATLCSFHFYISSRIHPTIANFGETWAAPQVGKSTRGALLTEQVRRSCEIWKSVFTRTCVSRRIVILATVPRLKTIITKTKIGHPLRSVANRQLEIAERALYKKPQNRST